MALKKSSPAMRNRPGKRTAAPRKSTARPVMPVTSSASAVMALRGISSLLCPNCGCSSLKAFQAKRQASPIDSTTPPNMAAASPGRTAFGFSMEATARSGMFHARVAALLIMFVLCVMGPESRPLIQTSIIISPQVGLTASFANFIMASSLGRSITICASCAGDTMPGCAAPPRAPSNPPMADFSSTPRKNLYISWMYWSWIENSGSLPSGFTPVLSVGYFWLNRRNVRPPSAKVPMIRVVAIPASAKACANSSKACGSARSRYALALAFILSAEALNTSLAAT